MISFAFVLGALIANLEYGELYVLDEQPPTSPVQIRLSYGIDLSNSFLNLHSAVGDVQVKVWNYLSTGVLGQWVVQDLSSTGVAFKQLENYGLTNKIRTPAWAVFSHSQARLLRGRWNLFNALPVEAEILVGGGIGLYREKRDIDEAGVSKISYVWSATNRFQFWKGLSLDLGLIGHRGGVYFLPGFSLSL